MPVSRRLEAVQSPIIPIVGDLIRQTPGTISLGQGVVYYGPPREAVDAIPRFLADPSNHKYKPVEGIPALVDALAAKLKAENGISSGRIVVTAGGNMGFLNAVLAIADPGDEILLPLPYYFNHEMALVMSNVRPVLVPTDDQYQLRIDAIRSAITPRTRAVVTVSPNNPTGAVYPEAALRELNALCRERGIYHIHDEAYEYFTYGVRAFSPGSIPGSEGHTISLYSLSKAYGFASWRIGYMVIPEALFEAVRKIQDTNVICPPVVSQFAALGALQAGSAYCRERMRPIVEVRETALRELATVADLCTVPRADGAFYFLLRVRTDRKPLEIVERLVREHRVAVIPGTAFGVEDRCTLRLAYGALEKETATEGIGRFVRGLRAVVGR
jgi:aspartate/methionine/tyrosine aminotransferase